MPNTELFKKIHEQITAHPETHNQAYWGVKDSCGTTHCIAGWALHFTIPPEDQVWDGGEFDAVREDGQLRDVHDAAKEKLGLTNYEANDLFYADKDYAASMVASYARGESSVWPR